MQESAMIWGAAGGIGRAVTEAMQARGIHTIGISRHAADNPADVALEANIAHAPSVAAAAYAANLEAAGPIKLWVYAAGDIVQARVDAMTAEQWAQIVGANLTGAFLATHASAPLLAPQAHLFYIGAITERLQLPSLSAYVAAKAGLEAFLATLQKEQRQWHVTNIRPGAVDTPFWDRVSLRKPKDAAPAVKVAQRLLTAYDQQERGTIDLTH